MRHHNQWYDDDSHEAQAYSRVMQAEGHHKAHLSHELIAAAASYEAMKAYNHHCEKNGKPVSHAQAKEILAGFSGAFIDRIVETKGLDFIDRQKAKHHSYEQLHYASERDYYDDSDVFERREMHDRHNHGHHEHNHHRHF